MWPQLIKSQDCFICWYFSCLQNSYYHVKERCFLINNPHFSVIKVVLAQESVLVSDLLNLNLSNISYSFLKNKKCRHRRYLFTNPHCRSGSVIFSWNVSSQSILTVNTGVARCTCLCQEWRTHRETGSTPHSHLEAQGSHPLLSTTAVSHQTSHPFSCVCLICLLNWFLLFISVVMSLSNDCTK